MTVSVIIPTRNRKDLLVTTLNNVLSQSLPPHEVIVVDDHSTDGSAEYISSLFKGRVIVLTNEGNGPGAARNTGMHRATGSFIKFFDSDDLMTLNTLKVQVDAIGKTKKGCVYSSYFHASQTAGGTWRLTDPAVLQYNAFPATHPFSHWMLRGLFITVPSFLFTRELLGKVGDWRTDIVTYEDWDFQWRVAQLEPQPAQTNECAFLYRKHGTQTTGVHFNSSQRDREKLICFANIFRGLRERSDISSVDKLIFGASIADVLKKNSSEEWAKDWGTEWGALKYTLGSTLNRVLNKLGRMTTHTDWQPMHGPRIDYRLVQKYLKEIDPASQLELPEGKF